METLHKIIEMDKAARARVEALREEQALKSEAAAKAAEQDALNSINSASSELEAFRGEQQKILSERKSHAAENIREQKNRLDEIFASNREQWKNEIFKRVTGD